MEKDVIAALRSGHLAGAYLDVFEREPLDPASPLWDMPNVIVSPHTASHSLGQNEAIFDIFLDNLARFRAGGRLRNDVDDLGTGQEADMDLGLKGKRVAVTGGSKGIGRAIAEGFAAEGADVSICARNGCRRRDDGRGAEGKGVKAFGKALDVADGAALKGWIAATRRRTGRLDALVCNVSALAVGDSAETWEKSFRTDMMHTVNAVAAPRCRSSRSPPRLRSRLISSVSGFEVDFAAGSYGAMKAALIHYAKGLSRQLVGKGIRVNCVSPGNTYFDGGIWQTIEKNMPDLFASTLKVNPTGKFGTAEEVANGVVFLASPMASRISGTNLVIDGALTVAV